MIEAVKDAAGFVLSFLVVRRAEDSCRRSMLGNMKGDEGYRNGSKVGYGLCILIGIFAKTLRSGEGVSATCPPFGVVAHSKSSCWSNGRSGWSDKVILTSSLKVRGGRRSSYTIFKKRLAWLASNFGTERFR